MDRTEQEKLSRFLNDRVMSGAVYRVLENTALKHPIQEHIRSDIHMLAASRLAVDLLKEAWKELEKYRQVQDDTRNSTENVGL